MLISPPRPSRATGTTRKSLAVHNSDTGPVARAAISLEYASLRYHGHCPLGMYATPYPADVFIWDAVLFVHQGYYADSILKFRLTFPSDYPERAPVVQFMTDIFHPLISQQDGTFNIAPRFRPWRPKEHHVYDVLHWIKASFKKHALDQIKESECSNKEAFRYHDSTSSFAALATQSSMLSQTASALFDSDHPSMANKGPAHSLIFKELKPEQSSALRAKLGLQEWEVIEDPKSTS
ncbi:UBC-like protein [Auriscalpium vulgare]|uniref:UBC-like protein n=1 Tax=Auriscalpium vulgare TaxID=40419 RepID=A0ACB8SBL7_9AGAM|nr:UBC-like protein [Auriscalpium vulgare]